MNMELKNTKLNCQLPALQNIQEGRATMPRPNIVKRLKFVIRRRLRPDRERNFKYITNRFLNKVLNLMGSDTKPAFSGKSSPSIKFKAGDHVLIRSHDEIIETLNQWHQLKGCTFMPEMAKYCGSRQQVFKRMERFVDERDFQVKKSSGIILLKNLYCEGTADFGSCDRSCHYFWREEWLKIIDAP